MGNEINAPEPDAVAAEKRLWVDPSFEPLELNSALGRVGNLHTDGCSNADGCVP
jgi:hypothetical protein